jgi:hypothetical protein
MPKTVLRSGMPIRLLSELCRLGAREVDRYEAKLLSFGRNQQKVFEFLSEARAARQNFRG